MSVIRKVPFIEQLLGSMSETQLKKLKTIINSGGGNVDLSFATLTNTYKNDVTPVYFHFEDANVKTAILIWNNTYCALICYHRFPDLALFKLDTAKHTYEKVNEYCDINELRRVLDDTFETKGTVDSGDANANTVPVADGNGGTEWTYVTNAIKNSQVSSGDAISLLGFDSSGNVIKDSLPEGIVVDETLDTSSTNAIANKPVAEAIEGIENSLASAYDSTATYNTGDYVIYENQLYICKGSNVTGTWDASKWEETNAGAELDKKANKDGNYPTLTSGLADNLTPYDSESGDEQDEPFIIQATGTANGTQPDFATGSYGLLKEKRGNTVVVNQLCADSIENAYSNLTPSAYEGTKGYYQIATYSHDELVVGHEVLAILKVSNLPANFDYAIMAIGGSNITVNNSNIAFKVITVSDSTYRYLRVFTTTLDTFSITVDIAKVIDLTQMFGGNDNIPSDLLSHPENFFRYYQGSLAYNTGELVNSNGRYIKCVGRNSFNGQVKVGYYLDSTTGQEVANANSMVSDGYSPCVPNAQYYKYDGWTTDNVPIYFYDSNYNFISREYKTNQTLTTPPNACFYRLSFPTAYGVVYKNDITISLYYSGESGYDKHYDYELLTNTDTGSEVLRSAGSVYDIKVPSGEITRNVGEDNFANYTFIQSGAYWQCSSIPNGAKASGKTLSANGYIGFTDFTSFTSSSNTSPSFYIGESNMWVKNISSAPTGTFQYELATPTTEQGTPFSANLVIDDFGTMEWDNTSFNGVPQGNLIFYPVDYKAFLDTLYDRVEGTPSEVVVQSELSGEATARTTQDTILQNAIGGTLRQMLASNNSVDFGDTAFVNLDDYNWLEYSTGKWNTPFTLAKQADSDSSPSNLLATNYKTISASTSTGDNVIKLLSNTLYVYSATKPTGLLAYEKASS